MIYLYIYIYIYIYIHLHTYIHTYIHTYTSIHTLGFNHPTSSEATQGLPAPCCWQKPMPMHARRRRVRHRCIGRSWKDIWRWWRFYCSKARAKMLGESCWFQNEEWEISWEYLGYHPIYFRIYIYITKGFQHWRMDMSLVPEHDYVF